MGQKDLTGICFCYENGRPDTFDIMEITAYAKEVLGVKVIWKIPDIPITDSDKLAGMIKNNELKRIIIAGDKPGMLKPYFANAMIKAGRDPKDITLASFREHGIFGKNETQRAKAILNCAFKEIYFIPAAATDESTSITETLVIGGGIAGIQASLEIANGNQKVYLVERTGTIGGHMAMFDKTFPTLDCAACILTPKMVEVGQHSNIELMTYCEVLDLKGEPGNYTVKILKKARRVNLASCTGCGTCSEKCPAKAPSEFDANTTLRKAIYIPFPQAVPNKYLIDAESCTWVQSEGKKCGVCAKVCPVVGCINLEEKDQEVEIKVGNIIVATGFKTFDARRIEQYGYGKYPNVITSLELERLVNAAGPTGGNIVYRTQDKKENWIFSSDSEAPKSFALIHCIGSRDENYNKYCSRVCCMYSLKLAHLIKEKIHDAEVYEYFIDMRSFGKGYEEFYERIKDEGVHIIRGRTAKIEGKDGKLLLRSENIFGEKLDEKLFDMVVLAVGLEPREDAEKLASLLGIKVGEDGWFNEANYNSDPVGTFTGGISIAGVCQGPKDIPDTVAQASGAAAKVIQSIIKGKIKKSVKELTLDQITQNVKKLSAIKEEQL